MGRKYTDKLTWTEYPVADGNYDDSRSTIDRIVLHHTNSTFQSAVSWFGNPKAGTSAHYVIGNDGKLAAMLEEYNTAYHSGNYAMNQRSVGIETEFYNGMVRSEILYKNTAILVADLCKTYSIPCDRQHILKHSEVVATSCPGALDVDRVVRDANQINNPTQTTENPDKKLADEFRKLQQSEFAGGVWYEAQNIIQYIKDRIKERDDARTDASSKSETINNLNGTINEKNNTLTKLTSDRDLLADQLKECQFRVQSLTEAGSKLIELQNQVTELERQKKTWIEAEGTYNRQIAQYKAKLAFSGLSWKNQLLKIYEYITKS